MADAELSLLGLHCLQSHPACLQQLETPVSFTSQQL